MNDSKDRPCRWCREDLPLDAESLCAECQEKEAMLKEGLTRTPDPVDGDALERFFWKLAVYAMKGMEPKMDAGEIRRFTIGHVRNSLVYPIVTALPLFYISLTDEPKENPDELLKDVVYTIKAPIPRGVLFKVVEKLDIWHPVDDELDNYTGT